MSDVMTPWDNATIIHLTHTGPLAGRLLCGENRVEEREHGAMFAHAMYAPRQILEHPKLCKVCKKTWEEA